MIGAGPAGAVAARQLAQQGLQTLLVERQTWPRNKVCGGCLNGRALSVLKAIGLERTLNDSHAAPSTRLIVQARNKSAEVNLPGGVAINRLEFDAALVKTAIEAGATFLPATQSCDPTAKRSNRRSPSYTYVPTKCGRTNDSSRRYCSRWIGTSQSEGTARVFVSNRCRGAMLDSRSSSSNCRQCIVPAAIYMAISRSGYVGVVRTMDGSRELGGSD